MEKKPFLTSALWPGIVLGLLSVIPVVNYGNIFCCLWVLGGGVLAAVVYKGEAGSITTKEGAIVGSLAGIIGAFVISIGTGILWYFFNENYLADLNNVVRMGEIDPEMITMMADIVNNPVLVILGSLVFYLFLNALMGGLGGFIGATVINRREGAIPKEPRD
ncbi:MAG: hypothetical protein ACP5G4_00740 [bacterium]